MSNRDDTTRGIDRRSVLSTLAAGGLATGTGCLGVLGGGKSKFQKQLATVEEATAKYEDPKKALKDGFKPGGPYVPGMGWHFTHPKRGKQAAKNGFDLEKPNVLTYLEADDGLRLGAAEFGAPVTAVPKNPDLFGDEDADATEKWHTHHAATHVFASGDGSQTPPKKLSLSEMTKRGKWTEFSPPDPKLSPGDTVKLNWGTPHGKKGERTERTVDVVTTHPDLRTLHVWIHTENPEGTFAPVNPDYKKGSGGHDH